MVHTRDQSHLGTLGEWEVRASYSHVFAVVHCSPFIDWMENGKVALSAKVPMLIKELFDKADKCVCTVHSVEVELLEVVLKF